MRLASLGAVCNRGLAELVEESLASDNNLLTTFGTLPWLVLMLERAITDPTPSLRAAATDILWMLPDLNNRCVSVNIMATSTT